VSANVFSSNLLDAILTIIIKQPAGEAGFHFSDSPVAWM
jgi:hypothetical protein